MKSLKLFGYKPLIIVVLVIMLSGLLACSHNEEKESANTTLFSSISQTDQTTTSVPALTAPVLNSSFIEQTITSTDGYKYLTRITIWDPIKSSSDTTVKHPDDANHMLNNFDFKKDIAIPLTSEVINQTPDFALENIRVRLDIIGTGKTENKSEPNSSSITNAGLDFTTFYSSGESTQNYRYGYSDQNGWGASWANLNDMFTDVNWSNIPVNGKATSHSFIIIHDYFTPAFPNGKESVLNGLAIKAGITGGDEKFITLSGKEINSN